MHIKAYGLLYETFQTFQKQQPLSFAPVPLCNFQIVKIKVNCLNGNALYYGKLPSPFKNEFQGLSPFLLFTLF